MKLWKILMEMKKIGFKDWWWFNIVMRRPICFDLSCTSIEDYEAGENYKNFYRAYEITRKLK